MKFSLKKIIQYFCLLLLGIVIVGLVVRITLNLDSVAGALVGVADSLRAIVLGCVMAYLLYPLTRLVEHFLLYRNVKKKTARTISTAVSALALLGVLFLIIYFLVPQLVLSLPDLAQRLPWMLRSSVNQLTKFLEAHGQSTDFLQDISGRLTKALSEWLRGDPLSDLVDLASRVVDIAKNLLNFVIGIIVMIYVLMSRDHFVGQGKKLLFALCKKQSLCDTILRHLHMINKIFSGFVSGKLLDSLIIGILCGISLSVLNVPYPLIISVIVGITNIIPVFGPFFGAIPSAFLLLLTEPSKCLVFLVVIIVIQQLDGNIIGPKVLGDSTGLSAFWVLFSLLLFNHLMGFWGMLLGVPLFASFYYLSREFINSRLRKKNLPTNTQEYVNATGLDPDGSIHYTEPKMIQFYPLLRGENSYFAQARAWLNRPIPEHRRKASHLADSPAPPEQESETPDAPEQDEP